MPVVSVIIPTYNRSTLVCEAVDSVLRQTYSDFELIVVDDGSTDGTARALDRFSGRLRYVRQENHGPAAARNLGISQARGDYIAFLDSDDLWLPTKLAKQMEQMEAKPDTIVCYTDEIWLRRGIRVNPRKKHRKRSGWIFAHSLPLCIVSPSSVLMHRRFFDVVGLFDETLPAAEDYDLWLRAAAHFPFRLISEKLIIKRGGHEDQLSRRWGLDRYRVRALVKLLESGGLSRRQDALTRKQLTLKCQVLEQGFRKRGKLREADYYREVRERYSARRGESTAVPDWGT